MLDNMKLFKIPQLVQSCMMKCINICIKLIETGISKNEDSSLIFYTNIISSSFKIFSNLLIHNSSKFYEFCNDTTLHENICWFIYKLYKNATYDVIYEYFDSILQEYTYFWNTNTLIISDLSFDIIETTFSCFSYIF